MQLLGLPPLGIPRLDDDPGLADLVDPTTTCPAPPAFGTAPSIPAPPSPPRAPRPLPPLPDGPPQPTPRIVLRNGSTLPPPNDVRLPRQPAPPA
jgi:hypothetical protein